jgi:hypothetical protein
VFARHRTRSLEDSSIFNRCVFKSTARFAKRNQVWTRIENTERSNELLPGENALAPNFKEMPVGRAQECNIGYDRDFDIMAHFSLALGMRVALHGVPEDLKVLHGSHPAGVEVFVRVREFCGKEK